MITLSLNYTLVLLTFVSLLIVFFVHNKIIPMYEINVYRMCLYCNFTSLYENACAFHKFAHKRFGMTLVTNVSISHFVISFLVIHKKLLGCEELDAFVTTNFTLKLFLHNTTFIQVFPNVLTVQELFTTPRTPVWPDIPMQIQMPLKVCFLEETFRTY